MNSPFKVIFVVVVCGVLPIKGQAQIFKKVIKEVRKITTKVDPHAWKPGSAITTSINDTLYGFDWFDKDFFDPEMADTIADFRLKPGYYKATVRSYCLRAGVYGPTQGDGYQIAKLKGLKTGIIHSILKKSVDFPEIPQPDIQTLIWGIEAGAKFSDYPLDFQSRVKPLLTAKELLTLQVSVKNIANKHLPEEVRFLADTYMSLRDKMQSTQLKYDELEAIAVKTGIAPLGPGSKIIDKGIWSYIGRGFYLRSNSRGYSETDIELYRPARLDIVKDEKGRVTTISYEGNSIQIRYNDKAGETVFSYGKSEVPVWKMETITFTGQEPGQRKVIKNGAWMFRGALSELAGVMEMTPNPEERKQPGFEGHGPYMPDMPGTISDFSVQETQKPTWEQMKERYEQMKKWIDQYKEYKGYVDEAGEFTDVKPIEEYLNVADLNKRIYDAIKAAMNPTDFKGRSDWMRKHFKMTMDMWIYSICALQGGCGDNEGKSPDLPSYVGQPGNTSKQRIGLSEYKEQ
ncbi:hypothetical protein ED312_07915 [Sinomicrobium pectinilyticum]|uniref:Uncharacterized protein n=1 Tax=Sinomicrobium pectinilyticum TaxID=1084421 RepID=A0A3N0ELE3_SINP1|nr:hypothetical protein [Sinomicrobium pectinilyticum]RNL88705.1 hypothetical protein ED312_07915 [Sinomicrobium pectinilyticum]